MTIEMILVYVSLMCISAGVGWHMGRNRGMTQTIAKLVTNKYVAYRHNQATGEVSLIEHPEAKDGGQ